MIQNDYRMHYLEIIEHAKSENRTKKDHESEDYIYYEDHHIIPKSLGGSNEPHNMVLLTAEEHFKVHILLTYFTEGSNKDKMIYAWHGISSRNKMPIDYSEYTELKESHAKVVSKRHKGIPKSEDHKKKIGKAHKNKIVSKETRQKLSEANKGNKLSEETKMKISEAGKGRHHTDLAKKKIGDAHRGKKTQKALEKK